MSFNKKPTIKVKKKGEARNEFNESIVHNYTLTIVGP